MSIGKAVKLYESAVDGQRITLVDGKNRVWGVAIADGLRLECDRTEGRFTGRLCPMTGTVYMKKVGDGAN